MVTWGLLELNRVIFGVGTAWSFVGPLTPMANLDLRICPWCMFLIWEEAREPSENADTQKHKENLHTECRGSNQQLSSCEVMTLKAAEDCKTERRVYQILSLQKPEVALLRSQFLALLFNFFFHSFFLFFSLSVRACSLQHSTVAPSANAAREFMGARDTYTASAADNPVLIAPCLCQSGGTVYCHRPLP